MTANTFGLHISTVSKLKSDVCNCITYKLGPKYIALPKTKEEMLEKVGEFEAKFGMTQAFGCIDGTHVPILRPSEHSQDYFSYKMYFSLNVQAVCDFCGYIMDVGQAVYMTRRCSPTQILLLNLKMRKYPLLMRTSCQVEPRFQTI